MTTIIEKDSPFMPLLFLGVLFLLLLGGGLGLAYMGGVFTGKKEVIENDKRITDQSRSLSAPSPPHGPVGP